MDPTLQLRLPGPLTATVVARWCEALGAGLRSGGVRQIVCHLDGAPDDLSTVDALARLALTARRAGVPLDLRRPDDELLSLLRLVGLAGLLDGRAPDRG